MKINSKSLVKFIVVLGIVLMGSLLLLSLDVRASYITPQEPQHYSFPQPSAIFENKSTSNYYHSIWNAAANNWNNTKAFSWYELADPYIPNYSITTSSVQGNPSDDWTGNTYSQWENINGQNIENAATMVLNRAVMKNPKYNYSKLDRIRVAEHEMGHAMGLAHNRSYYSVMYHKNRYENIHPCDIRGVEHIYGEPLNVPSHYEKRNNPYIVQSVPFNSVKSQNYKNYSKVVGRSLNIDYVHDYNGDHGLNLLKYRAPIIVQGTIVNSKYHNEKTLDNNYYTTQTLNIVNSLKGHLKGFIKFNQNGTNKVRLDNSTLLTKNQNVIVMLDKDNNGNYYVINNGQGIFIENNLLGSVKGNNDPSFTRASDNSIYPLNTLK